MKVKRVGPHSLPLPRQETLGSAGYDLRSTIPTLLYPGDQQLIPTGFSWEIPEGWVGIIKDRSGLATKHTRTAAGVVDSDYRGEVKVLLRNASPDKMEIQEGDRIAQLLVVPCLHEPLEEVGELAPSSRGENGFGSTGNS
jgi:dUTP pyrophosphatase